MEAGVVRPGDIGAPGTLARHAALVPGPAPRLERRPEDRVTSLGGGPPSSTNVLFSSADVRFAGSRTSSSAPSSADFLSSSADIHFAALCTTSSSASRPALFVGVTPHFFWEHVWPTEINAATVPSITTSASVGRTLVRGRQDGAGDVRAGNAWGIGHPFILRTRRRRPRGWSGKRSCGNTGAAREMSAQGASVRVCGSWGNVRVWTQRRRESFSGGLDAARGQTHRARKTLA